MLYKKFNIQTLKQFKTPLARMSSVLMTINSSEKKREKNGFGFLNDTSNYYVYYSCIVKFPINNFYSVVIQLLIKKKRNHT